MSPATPSPDRRLDRSLFADLALEKFLARVREDLGLRALVLADETGQLLAGCPAEAGEQALSALGALSADLRSRLEPWPELAPLSRLSLKSDRGATLLTASLDHNGNRLGLILVGLEEVPAEAFDRIEAGVRRILETARAPEEGP